MTTNQDLYIGLMSGTSVDAVDATLVAFNDSDTHPKLEALYSLPIPEQLKKALLDCNQRNQLSLEAFCQLQVDTGHLFAEAVHQLLKLESLPAGNITAIGSHGQTIFHAPEIGMSLQTGHPAIIAKQTGIKTVADFRIDDMALGGQGAPFAPAFHQHLFAEPEKSSVAVNIGGIANISLIPAGNVSKPLLGFDTGPGNSLMDEVCQRFCNQPYDENGNLAKSGTIHSELLEKFLSDDYFAKAAPKSTGRDKFNWQWLNQFQPESIQPNSIQPKDLLATLTELTAITIAQAISSYDEYAKGNVWICGGGAFNEYLMQRLQSHLPNAKVRSANETGIHPTAIEGMLFAWLAKQRLNNRPVNLKDVTGASRNAILGGVWQP